MDFQYCHNPGDDVPIMLLLEDIGIDEQTGKGIDGAKFLGELLTLEAMKPKSIEVWINSAGGVVAEGYSIYSAILDSKIPVDTKCVGMAASISAVIFQAGRNRIMNDYSWLMFHNPYGGDDKKLLNVMKDSISKMIARCGRSEDEILDMMKRTTYIYADEAKQLGLADKVDASDQKNKKRLTSFTQPHDFHREVNLVVNKLFEIKPAAMSSIKITNKLGLNSEASEDSVLEAITRIQDKAKDEKIGLEGQINDLQKKMDDQKSAYEKDCKDLQDEMDKLTKEKAELAKQKDAIAKEKDTMAKAKDDADTELDKMKKDKEAAEDAMKEEKAKNLAINYAKVGRIRDEKKVIDFWTAQLMADETIAKDQIESLPLNKTAAVINKIDPVQKISAAGVMSKINKRLEDERKQNIN